jgi:putative transcriptional regulator
MSEKTHGMSVFDQIKAGLEDSIAHSKGKLSLVTTELPAPPPPARPYDVVRLRKRFRMSQAVFAAVMNVSAKTVQSWEQGARGPSDAALRMLQIIRQRPEVVKTIFAATAKSRPRLRPAAYRKRAATK